MYLNSNHTKFNGWNSSALVYVRGGLEAGQFTVMLCISTFHKEDTTHDTF